ncbi:DDE-type integrase/transposase/recombinase [Candidatus Trichorickettsia mobilis]|uniref:DDE-type integrase/transposase/recombinase n=1 Tax=Candidatus Trichorickettsia mobilis TaxID=1346319 RepID=UPI002B260E1C|nr:DDE-type integrase/transposase/recombinase [Candidatus Trichorickettsia mobilis]
MPFNISSELLKHFKGFCSSLEIIRLLVYMKCRFSLSYPDLEEMASIRGAKIDHATLQRWVIKFVPLIDAAVRKRKKRVGSDSNISALKAANKYLHKDQQIEVRQVKYLNNIVGQNHRFIKKRPKPMLGFKSFRSAKITITGTENIRIIQKEQIIESNNNLSTFANFKMLMVA